MVSATIKNSVQLSSQLKALETRLRDAADRQLASDIKKVDTYVKKKIQQGTRSGRAYRRGDITHIASAPGEFPKTDTGRLVGAFRTLVNKGTYTTKASLLNPLSYASYLEFKPASEGGRPFMRPTFKVWSPKITNNIEKALKREIKRIVNG